MLLLKDWEKLCKRLNDENINSSTISDLLESKQTVFIALKHDVETNCLRALRKARIEAEYNHKATYYVQAYLLDSSSNVEILKEIQSLGHEVSYHHDVMDSNGGNIVEAIEDFKQNIHKFQRNGFLVKTVCQHGNPIVKREGYTSNRDFFRSELVNEQFSTITEVMVDLKKRIGQDYSYYSDAGYGWKFIFDPEENDRNDSGKNDEVITDMDSLIDRILHENGVVISSHPHRWYKSKMSYVTKQLIFSIVKRIALILMRVPLLKRIIEKNYKLAKKF